jgi:hypothetical protein
LRALIKTSCGITEREECEGVDALDDRYRHPTERLLLFAPHKRSLPLLKCISERLSFHVSTALIMAYYDELQGELALETTVEDRASENEGAPLKPFRPATMSNHPSGGPLRTPRPTRAAKQSSEARLNFPIHSARASVASASPPSAYSRSSPFTPTVHTTPHLADEPPKKPGSTAGPERANNDPQLRAAPRADGDDGPRGNHDDLAVMLRRSRRRDTDELHGIA